MPGFFNTRNYAWGAGVHFKMFGKWEETIRAIQRLGPSIKIASIEAQWAVCREIEKRVKDHLRNQDLGWRALSPNYAEMKAAKGWDDRILIMSGAYYHAIEAFRKGNSSMIFVGVKKGKYGVRPDGRRSKLEIAEIAAIHEFSQDKKRRRPLWNPTIKEMGSSVGIKELYLKHFIKNLKKLRVPISSVLPTLKWL